MKVKLLLHFLVFFSSFFMPYLLQAQADLIVVQAVSNNVSANRNLTYTILVVNNGPANATNVNLTENLPVGTTFVSFSAPSGWNVVTPTVGVNAPVIATIPSLTPGVIQNFTLVVNVGSTVFTGQALISTALVSSTTPDPDITNNQSSGFTVVSVVPTFDIGLVNRVATTVNIGGKVIYLIQVSNPAIGLQLGVSFADILPPGTSFVSLSAPVGWTIVTPAVGSNGIITASIPTFAPDAIAAFILVANVAVNVPSGTIINNTASVTSLTPDLNPNNNTSGFGVRVLSPVPADLSIIKTGPVTITAGSNVTYTVIVRNNGPNNAENVSWTDGLQSGSTFISIAAPQGWVVSSPQPGTSGLITATIAMLANGATATFTLVVRAADNLSGTLNNTASISSGNVDPIAGNNFSTSTANNPGGTCSITYPADIVVTSAPGQCGAVVNFPFPSISGNCGTVTAVPTSGSFFPVGTTTVRISTSTGGTCLFNIRVNETQPPVITTCPALAPLCGNSSGIYTIPRLVATDNCGPAIINYTISGATNRSGNGDNASGFFSIGTSTILWTVRDSSNNTTSCQTKVTVNNPVAVNIPDATALSTGVNINTVYPGYAPASKITLTATTSGGTPPYTYSWSNGATTASIDVSPMSASSYRVTVTDSFGCKQVSAEKLVKVEDVACGTKEGKVQVCIVPPGNFGVSYNSCVEAGVVASLLKAGSHLGSCSTKEDYSLSLKAVPNPTYSYFTVDVISNNLLDKITVNIYTITGRLVESRTVNANSKIQIGASYPTGTYLAEAVQGTKKASLILIKLK
jgi:uncharacterized repeat protein (TIGR01451 family)